MNQLDEFLEKADLPQEEPQPLAKPLVCPECGCKEVEEITPDMWRVTTFEWDEKSGGYKEYDENTEGTGVRYLQCRNCAYEYPYETLEQFDASNPTYKCCAC